MLSRDEYVEQAYFFRTLRERVQQAMSTQDLLRAIRQELLATTMLPFAVDFMADELQHTGGFASAMARLPHYFTPFQAFLVAEAEREGGKFDLRVGLEILEREADYRGKGPSPQGVFLYEFEAICRNRLGYDRGLEAIGGDPMFDDNWREWIDMVRRQVGLVDFCDMVYVRSDHYRKTRGEPEKPPLFGEKEGRIALANRRKDPLYLFAALQRHLGYPPVPFPKQEETQRFLLPALERRCDRMESRIKLLEEELRGGINLQRFYEKDKEAE